MSKINYSQRKAEYEEKKYLSLRASGVDVFNALQEARKSAERIFGPNELKWPDPAQIEMF